MLQPEVIQNKDCDRRAGGQRIRRTSDLSQLTPAYSGRQIHRPVPVSQLPVENAASHRHPGIHTTTYTGHVAFVTIPINLLTYLLTLSCSQHQVTQTTSTLSSTAVIVYFDQQIMTGRARYLERTSASATAVSALCAMLCRHLCNKTLATDTLRDN